MFALAVTASVGCGSRLPVDPVTGELLAEGEVPEVVATAGPGEAATGAAPTDGEVDDGSDPAATPDDDAAATPDAPSGTTGDAPRPTTPPGATPGDPAEPRPPAGDAPPAEGDPSAPTRTPGTYSYDTEGSTSTNFTGERELPPTTTLEVRPPQGGRQVSLRDLRDEEGQGSVTESEFVFDAEGVSLARLKVTTVVGDGFTDEREWVLEPPQRVATWDAAPGDELTFTMDDGDTRADVTITILREEDITIGDETVPAVVARTRTVLSGDVEGEQQTLSWIRRDDFLTLREEYSSDVRSGPIRAQGEYEAQLVSTTPR